MGLETGIKILGQCSKCISHTRPPFAAAPKLATINPSELKICPNFFKGKVGDVVELKSCMKVAENAQRNNTTKQILIDLDGSLFKDAIQQPELMIEEISPKSLAMLHMTNFFPKNGKILSTKHATMGKQGVAESRTTIHFSLNKPVTEHILGNQWHNMDYAIILPFDKTIAGVPKTKVLGGIQEDFFIMDEVKLPKGSTIVKYNESIPIGKMQVSETFDGIKLVETSERDTSKIADLVLHKMGYATYTDMLKKYLGATDEEIRILTSHTDEEVLAGIEYCKHNSIDDLLKNLKESLDIFRGDEEEFKRMSEYYSESEKWYKTLDKFKDSFPKAKEIFSKSWAKFTNKNSYINGLHSQTSWGRSEFALCGIELCELLNKNSWNGGYKERLLKVFLEAKKSLPADKTLGYDIDSLITIVDTSSTPREALETIKKELKIIPTKSNKKSPEEAFEFDPKDKLDMLFLMFGV